MPANISQRRFLIYGAFVSVVGIAALAWQSPHIAWAEWPVMVALAILEVAARRYAFTVGGLVGLSLDTGVHFASVVILGPSGAALIAFVSTVIALLANPIRRYPWLWQRMAYLGFNGGMFALMQLVSGQVYVRIGGPHPAIALLSLRTWLTTFSWVLVYHLFNLLIAYPALLVSGRLSWQVVRKDPGVFATEALMLPVGMLLVVVYNVERWVGLALFGSVLILASALLKRLVETGDRLRGQLNSAAALTEAGQALAASLDADKIVELVYQLATKVLTARTFFVALYDEAQGELFFPVLVEEGARRPAARVAFEPGVGLTAYVITTRRPLLLNSAAEMAALPIRTSPVSGKALIESILAVPMIARERVLGVISAQSVSRGAYTEDDLATLSTLAQQAAIAIDNAELVRNLAAQERLRQEMEIARKTQRDLLPTAPPELPGLDVAGSSSPASIVGGDFFGYHSHPAQQRVSIAVGDVSGHGMPAALLMTLTVGLLEAESRDGVAPAELLAQLNAALKPHCARSRLNVAVCYALLQSDGALQAANAGGIAPLLRRADGRIEWLEANGLPLGIELEDKALCECEARLEPGDALLLVTDGLVEAKNEAGEMFGFERCELAVSGASASSAAALQEHILKAMRAFTGSVEPQDDVTVVTVMRRF